MNKNIKNDINKKNCSSISSIQKYLNNDKPLLKFLTCGSVDDGKSTLIGRLLHDTQQIYEDQLYSLKTDSKRYGTQNSEIDLALVVDGLQDEREQGITIDVAYRYFSTNKRKFIIADTPGHEQYTRNMVTGASTCELSILLVDIIKGLSQQTYRHAFLSSLLGIRHLIVAVNKMDAIEYQEKYYSDVKKHFLDFSKKLDNILNIYFIPVSALIGDNIVSKSLSMPWYRGPTLLHFLETIDIRDYSCSEEIRFPIQYINRPNPNFRGYSGMLVSGEISVGQAIKVLPGNINTYISRIVTFEKEIKKIKVGQSVTIVLKDEIDIGRGDFLVNINSKLELFQEAIVDIVWMTEDALYASQYYNIKLSGKKTGGYIKKILYKIDVNNLSEIKTNSLILNNIGRVHIIFDEPMIFDSYKDNRFTGNLILIDRLNNTTVGAGMIQYGLHKKTIKNNLNIKKFELELQSLIYRHFPHWNKLKNKRI